MLCPLKFRPIFKSRIWGGRALAQLLDKQLPPDDSIGESWELVDLPGDKSQVLIGPQAGVTIDHLVSLWGPDLLGSAPLDAGQFPLLIKFLDAQDVLSVQVHPDRASAKLLGPPARAKYEAWYIIAAQSQACIYRGFKPGTSESDVTDALTSGNLADLLIQIPVAPGQCYYLPGGTVHALGAGIVVAEIQTPSDTTFRLFDWNRIDPASGKGRELHIEQALQSIRYDQQDSHTAQAQQSPQQARTATSLLLSQYFSITRLQYTKTSQQPIPGGQMLIWIVLDGQADIDYRWDKPLPLRRGDVVLLPAALDHATLSVAAKLTILEVAASNQAR